jgi:hypothetical protein
MAYDPSRYGFRSMVKSWKVCRHINAREAGTNFARTCEDPDTIPEWCPLPEEG